MRLATHIKATAVVQDAASYEATQVTVALLKILALGNRQLEQGQVAEAGEFIEQFRKSKVS